MVSDLQASVLLPLIWRHRSAILISGIVVAGLAFGVGQILPLQYASSGSLIVQSHQTSADQPMPSVSAGALTQIDVLQSTGLLRSVVHNYKLADLSGLQPRYRLPLSMENALNAAGTMLRSFWPSSEGGLAPGDPTDVLVNFVQKRLEAKATENSGVINVRFVAGTPEVAASVTNAIMNTYLETVQAARDQRWSGSLGQCFAFCKWIAPLSLFSNGCTLTG